MHGLGEADAPPPADAVTDGEFSLLRASVNRAALDAFLRHAPSYPRALVLAHFASEPSTFAEAAALAQLLPGEPATAQTSADEVLTRTGSLWGNGTKEEVTDEEEVCRLLVLRPDDPILAALWDEIEPSVGPQG